MDAGTGVEIKIDNNFSKREHCELPFLEDGYLTTMK